MVLPLLLVGTGCGSAPKRPDIVGTWRFVMNTAGFETDMTKKGNPATVQPPQMGEYVFRQDGTWAWTISSSGAKPVVNTRHFKVFENSLTIDNETPPVEKVTENDSTKQLRAAIAGAGIPLDPKGVGRTTSELVWVSPDLVYLRSLPSPEMLALVQSVTQADTVLIRVTGAG